MFQVPSTPDSRRYTDDAPSTTPAGPPPTSRTNASFTPAGQPPSSVLGSSFGPGNGPKPAPFSFSQFLNSPQPREPTNRTASKTFAVPSSSPGRPGGSVIGGHAKNGCGGKSAFDTVSGDKGMSAIASLRDDTLDFSASPRAAKRMRSGDLMAQSVRSWRYGKPLERDPTMPVLLEGLVAGIPETTVIAEQDDVVLETESVLARLDKEVKSSASREIETAVMRSMAQLQQAWAKHKKHETLSASIGPVDKSSFSRAAYIATLLFALRQPLSNLSHDSGSAVATNALVPSTKPLPIPESLLSWLNKNHDPFPLDLEEVRSTRPSPPAHERFWDTIFQTLLRGHLSTVIDILSNADWTVADSALEDGYDTPGYHGAQLQAVQHVITRCVDLLRSCPALTDEDWNVTGPQWNIFRLHARRALDDLEDYAEQSSDQVRPDNVFAESSRGFAAGSRRAGSRVPWQVYEQLKAVYGQLMGYREEILLSAQDWVEAVIFLAVWWDGEDETSPAASRRGGYRRAVAERLVDVNSEAAYARRVLGAFADVTDEPEDAPLAVNTTDPVQVAVGAVFEGEVESVLKIGARWSPVVATAMVEFGTLGGWMPDLRAGGRVMDGFDAEDLMVLSHGQVNNQSKGELDRDSTLIRFAKLLGGKDAFSSSDGRTTRAGWELAVEVLSRLESSSVAQMEIGKILDSISLDSADQVDRVLRVCNELSLDAQARAISARYADKLSKENKSYGEALLYFARAHAEKDLQATLDLLLTTSLVRSAAWPTQEALDDKLAELLQDKRSRIIGRLARVDVEAARMLAERLSGYAALRRYYELRDEDLLGDDDDEDQSMADGDEVVGRSRKSGLKPGARRKEMVRAIVALIDSAASGIRGGLYDAQAVGVVPVDALHALLGEAMALMHQPGVSLTHTQLLTLLSAMEDLQTVSGRIYERSEALFHACLDAYSGAPTTTTTTTTKQATQSNGGADRPSTSSLKMQKSTSNLSISSSSAYGMVNSRGSIESERRSPMLLANGNGGGGGDGDGEDGKLLVRRAWDWRGATAMMFGQGPAGGKKLMRVLRVGIAKEVGKGWVG